jgi:hemolysin-activating ACP:hemolysin acyltransferase
VFYTDFVEMKANKYHLVLVVNQKPLAFVLWARHLLFNEAHLNAVADVRNFHSKDKTTSCQASLES